jgi:osmoprotectant transport system substrate-binding protein
MMNVRHASRMGRFAAPLVATVGVALTLTACGDDDASNGDTTESGGSITVGGAQFTEALLLEEAYRALLDNAGYDVSVESAESREIYEPLLESGELDVAPEYAATFAEFLNAADNGSGADPIATSDATETVEAVRPLAEAHGLQVLAPAQNAASQNGFAVTQEFAAEHGLATLSDLGALGEPIVLAATEECPDRPFCAPGLELEYGLDISEILPLGFGSPQTKDAVVSGEAQLGLVGTTDGTLADLGLVLLDDDLSLQLADNIVPVLNGDAAEDDGIADALAPFHETLTTEDIAMMQAQVDSERQEVEDVVLAYLEDKGLL